MRICPEESRYSGPADEIGELALTMDAMLDRLQSAFATQEQFISDASHELRTPLTIIKGHLQVLDRQESPDPAFVKQEHALVLDELDRMNRLVADLLTLARATRVDFLRKESIGLDAFLQSLIAQGPHLGERAWLLESLPGGSVQADQDRLTQVFLNLDAERCSAYSARTGHRSRAANALRVRVTLWVRDEGEGMSEDMVQARLRALLPRGRRRRTAKHSVLVSLSLKPSWRLTRAPSAEKPAWGGRPFLRLSPRVSLSSLLRIFSSDS